MAQQEEGWPLGLQPLNVRAGQVRNRGFNGSLSFSTLITGSPSSSTDSSSDLDTESTASFFRDKSITLGSLIGITSILELSRRSTRRRTVVVEPILRDKKKINNNKSRTWLFSLCSKLSTDAVNINNNSTPSLGHFLEAERRASASNNAYGPDDFNQLSDSKMNNSLFIGGQIAPPNESRKGLFEQDENGHGSPMIFSCLCGYLVH
ncbi:uncharacterized protein At3g17950-like isoform X1 [Nicotiana tomentosiformis]|uniref:uncharacterized protein At3g17950-like isoform X1 n=1 Tax=Nicotiana tomentosiformis TaxID=4098 RepID=UPI00051AC03A|nr:uncharacterized protein At3g17950-like isoform X1 [Nicotiana tomentosiformis]